jgi:hypothetical protein
MLVLHTCAGTGRGATTESQGHPFDRRCASPILSSTIRVDRLCGLGDDRSRLSDLDEANAGGPSQDEKLQESV